MDRWHPGRPINFTSVLSSDHTSPSPKSWVGHSCQPLTSFRLQVTQAWCQLPGARGQKAKQSHLWPTPGSSAALFLSSACSHHPPHLYGLARSTRPSPAPKTHLGLLILQVNSLTRKCGMWTELSSPIQRTPDSRGLSHHSLGQTWKG